MDRMFVIKSYGRQDNPRLKSAIARERVFVLDEGFIDGTYPVGPSYGTKNYSGQDAAAAAAEAAIEALLVKHQPDGERTRGFLSDEGMLRSWSQTPREQRDAVRAVEVKAAGEGFIWAKAATEAERVVQRRELSLDAADPCDFLVMLREKGKSIEAIAKIDGDEIVSVNGVGRDVDPVAVSALEAKLQPQMTMTC